MNLIPNSFWFDDFFSDFFVSNSNDMKCDIYEQDNKYHIEVDIPGFDKKDIKIEEENGYLTIIVDKDENKDEENKNYIRRERKVTKYKRSFYLGDINKEDISAEFKDGTLKIIVPKDEEKINKRVIEID